MLQSEKAQSLAAERAKAEVARQQRINREIYAANDKNLAKIKTLQEQVALQTHELKVLGKRPLECDPEEEAALQKAVESQIKRRRREPNAPESPVTLKERRAFDRGTIEQLIKENKNLLRPWTDILEACLQGKVPQPFLPLQSVDDHIDGFMLVAPPGFTSQKLARLLREHSLEVH